MTNWEHKPTPRDQAIEHGGPFRLIYADPPWRYSQNNQRCRGGALNHYSTMADDDIKDLPIGEFAEDNALLIMWATWPKLAVAVDVVRAWGFGDIITGCPWVKQIPDGRVQVGVGHWFRSTSEFITVARRGNAKLPQIPGGAPAGLMLGTDLQFYGKRREHSSKPFGLYEWLNCMPGPRLELFARRELRGWTCWGGDVGWWITPDGIEKHDNLLDSQRNLFEC